MITSILFLSAQLAPTEVQLPTGWNVIQGRTLSGAEVFGADRITFDTRTYVVDSTARYLYGSRRNASCRYDLISGKQQQITMRYQISDSTKTTKWFDTPTWEKYWMELGPWDESAKHAYEASPFFDIFAASGAQLYVFCGATVPLRFGFRIPPAWGTCRVPGRIYPGAPSRLKAKPPWKFWCDGDLRIGKAKIARNPGYDGKSSFELLHGSWALGNKGAFYSNYSTGEISRQWSGKLKHFTRLPTEAHGRAPILLANGDLIAPCSRYHFSDRLRDRDKIDPPGDADKDLDETYLYNSKLGQWQKYHLLIVLAASWDGKVVAFCYPGEDGKINQIQFANVASR